MVYASPFLLVDFQKPLDIISLRRAGPNRIEVPNTQPRELVHWSSGKLPGFRARVQCAGLPGLSRGVESVPIGTDDGLRRVIEMVVAAVI